MAVSWLKKGSDSQTLEHQEKIHQEQRRASAGKMFRFFLKAKEEATLTFVDGELSPEGFLIPPRFYEHMIQVGDKWETFVCPERTNPEAGDKCPICARGDNPSLISLFTVVDHRSFKRKDNSVVPFSKKLLAVKPQVMEILAKQALKRGGLSGCTYEVSRVGPQASAVGDMWEFVSKDDQEKLVAKFTMEQTDESGKKANVSLFAPADYEKEIVYFTGSELLQKGLGKAGGSGYAPGGSSGSGSAYKDNL
jgi:hypothetical protein